MTVDEMLNVLDKAEDSPFYNICNLIGKNDFSQATKVIKDYLHCDENTAKIVCMDFKTKVYDEIYKPDPDLSPQEIAHNNAIAKEWQNKPKCPTCSSTNVQKIGGLERAGSVYMFGIFSKKINKSFKCKNCGYTW
ncbi:MAG: hypothetical protein NC311_08830 [Muribaculaceae bacterium]|nr:hypothetical protein [Muribaculaceae bacterium]MCM1399931.1 hypothetical protein [Clostridium sp.]MCM1460733.1 hypothetical protein [Bacteroides sp.]